MKNDLNKINAGCSWIIAMVLAQYFMLGAILIKN